MERVMELMEATMVKLPEHHCLNPTCQHRWTPRINDVPAKCPKCGSYHWRDGEHWQRRAASKKKRAEG